ncbi:MAG TPA: tetratricopeptide repeat protein [Acidobacteriaceae bacterium]|nr:tetratricopeptide repeat protein [Acidobacteriaceae bacterium]
MPLPAWLVRRSALLPFLMVAPLLHATRDSVPDQQPASLATLQVKAAQGFVKQELELAADYFAGRGVPKDLVQAAYWYRKAADHGNPAAQNYLGYLYIAGLGVPRDQVQALRWYGRAALAGLPEAKVNLAALYMRGDGVRQDAQEGLRLLRSAASQRDGRADAYLGLASYLGSGVPVDHAAAQAWFKAGAKLLDPEAEFFLVVMDEKEPGRVADPANEARLLRLSASSGYVPAIHGLGLLLVNHPELPQAPQEATSLLLSAAGAGSWQSSAVLGMLARDGKLLPKDQTAAYRWFRIAVLQGGVPAGKYLHRELLRIARSVSDTAAAEHEVAEWMQAHPNHDLFLFTGEMNPKYFPIQEVYSAGQDPKVGHEAGHQTEQPN